VVCDLINNYSAELAPQIEYSFIEAHFPA